MTLAVVLIVLAATFAPAPRSAHHVSPRAGSNWAPDRPGEETPTANGMRTAPDGAAAGRDTPAVTPLRGKATFYCSDGRDGSPKSRCTRGYGPDDLVAAIDRKDTPWRKGDRVLVSRGDRSVVVEIVDVCRCAGARIIDLSAAAFAQLGRLSEGVIPVGITAADTIRLPETDTEVTP